MARWALVENDTIQELRDSLPRNWRNVSGLNLSADNLDFLRGLGWLPVTTITVEFDSAVQRIASYEYAVSGDSVTATPVLGDKPPSIPADTSSHDTVNLSDLNPRLAKAAQNFLAGSIGREMQTFCVQNLVLFWHDVDLANTDMATVRRNRDFLLQACDWTQLPDIVASMTPEQQQQWRDYRQILRDLPAIYAEGNLTAWPSPPTKE